ncbi:MAG: DUF4430 domain-containing protein [Eubacterium sp.]
MKKRIWVILLSVIMCLCLFGCSAEKSEITTLAPSETITVTEATEGQSATEATTNKNNTTEKKSTAKATKKSTEKSTTATTKKTVTKTTSAATTSKKETTSGTITCRVTVECKKILSNMDKLDEGHIDFVPPDGYILNNASVTVKNGATAYDAVKKACDENNIILNSTNSSYGVYIAGFNYIDEKDCGSSSGWLYSVNGKTPGKSCGKYAVQNGDSIVFSYTC